MLKCEGIYKSFGPTEALSGVDLEIRPGTITAVIGPSGSGKTTLMRCLSLLDTPTVGRITINGSSYTFTADRIPSFIPPWPTVTVVFQQLFLWPHLTLRENILLPLTKRNTDASNKITDASNKIIEPYIKTFAMEDFIDKYPNEISLGQRQRAAIVRALALKPKFILLDEITSALDVEQVAEILKELVTLRENGIGIMIVTHLLSFARRAADRVVFLDKGKVLEAGATDILDRPKNARLQEFLSTIESAR